MATVKNISPQGDLELPLVGRVIAAGETFDIPDDQAEVLAAQPDVWQIVTTSRRSKKK